MNLGSLVTVANAAPKNLFHFLMENGTYEANGSHPIPGRDRLDFSGLAKSAGYRASATFDALPAFESGIGGFLAQPGPVFATLKIVPGPPPDLDYGYMHSVGVRQEFRRALAADAPGA
jgi:sulfopyruvate decarboxylase subunit beta